MEMSGDGLEMGLLFPLPPSATVDATVRLQTCAHDDDNASCCAACRSNRGDTSETSETPASTAEQRSRRCASLRRRFDATAALCLCSDAEGLSD
ncbi:unnamed protein product [Gadus morhua 'NCC']